MQPPPVPEFARPPPPGAIFMPCFNSHAPKASKRARATRPRPGARTAAPAVSDREMLVSYQALIFSLQRGLSPESIDSIHRHQETESTRAALTLEFFENDANRIRGILHPRQALQGREAGAWGPGEASARTTRDPPLSTLYLLNHFSQRPAFLGAFSLIPHVCLLNFYLKTT